jgi:hypothetical protein
MYQRAGCWLAAITTPPPPSPFTPTHPHARYNVTQVTAVTVANGTGGGVEIHVAQRGPGAPPVLVFSPAGDLLRTWGNATTIDSIHGMKAQVRQRGMDGGWWGRGEGRTHFPGQQRQCLS